MKAVRSKNTVPELLVRRVVRAGGYRYQANCEDLPGSPDLVFKSRRKVIFVHGCFWHRHPQCPRASTPRRRIDYWQKKFDRNVERDAQVISLLRKDGWGILTIWECETRRIEVLEGKISSFL